MQVQHRRDAADLIGSQSLAISAFKPSGSKKPADLKLNSTQISEQSKTKPQSKKAKDQAYFDQILSSNRNKDLQSDSNILAATFMGSNGDKIPQRGKFDTIQMQEVNVEIEAAESLHHISELGMPTNTWQNSGRIGRDRSHDKVFVTVEPPKENLKYQKKPMPTVTRKVMPNAHTLRLKQGQEATKSFKPIYVNEYPMGVAGNMLSAEKKSHH